MNSSLVSAILPFWILGVLLLVAIISLLRLPTRLDLAAPHYRGEGRSVSSHQSV